MIDYFALALSHGLLALALLRLVMRDDLNRTPYRRASREHSTNGALGDSTSGNGASGNSTSGNAAQP